VAPSRCVRLPHPQHTLAVAFLAVCAGACTSGRDDSQQVATGLPGYSSLTLLACSEAEAWIGTGRSKERFVAGQPDALLVRVGRDGTRSERELPGTFVSTFQPSTGDGGWVVAVDVSGTEVVRSQLLAMRGQRVETVATPSGTFGGAFLSPSEGYVWGGKAVHQTTDGGRTWRRNRVDPGEIKRGPATMPQLSTGGDLWVPVQGSHGGALMVLQKDGANRTMAEWKGEEIWSVRLSQDGTSYMVLVPDASYGFRVLAIPPSGGVVRDVYRRPTGSVMEFTVSGPRLALLVVDGAPPSSPFGAWPRYLHTSTDGGKAWKVRSMTSARIESVCATPSGIWASSHAGRSLNFIRW
jgi:hypothetical protein